MAAMKEPGQEGAAPAAPLTGLDWRHVACAAHANNLPGVSQMLAAGADVNPEDGSTCVTALHWACFHGNQQMVEQLLAAGARVSAALGSGRTPLHLALLGGHSSIADRLVEAGADVNASSSTEGPPLALAVRSGDSGLVSRLLEAGAYPNISSGTGPTSLLLLAITQGHMQMAEQLLGAGAAAGADIVDGGDTQRTALHLAAQRGCGRLVELLLARDVAINARDSGGATPLLVAIVAKQHQVAGQLMAAGADCNIQGAKDGTLPIHLAAAAGDVQLVTALLAAGANPRQLNTSDCCPLHLAAAAGHTEVVDLLLAAPGVSPNLCNPRTQFTSLHAAASAGQHEVLQQLVAAGGDVSRAVTSTQATPLHEAIRSGSGKCVSVLLAAGAEPNAAHSWSAPLLLAVRVEAAADIVTALVERGANINALAPNGETVLHRAVRTRQHAMVELLIRLGADLSIASDSQGTPLHCAVQLGDDFIVQQLAAASGAPLNVISRSMSCAEACTPLYLAAAKGAAGMVKVLLAAGADASKGTHLGGVTPLHAALLGHHSGVAKQLLAAGADVNAVGQVVGTALVLALREGDQAMVEQLLAQGADPTLSSPGTVAPLTAAVISGNQKLLEQLLAAPAIQAATRAWQEQAPGNVTAVRHATGTAGGAGAAAAAAGAASSLGAESARPKRVQQHQGGSPLRRCNAMTPDQLELVAIPHGPHADGCHSSSSSSSSVSAIHDRMGAALLAAAEANAVDMVGMLRQAGASPNGRNAAGDALLHLAIAAADAAMVAQLLERGADPNLVGSEHVTPLCMAVAARDSRLVGLLLSAGARPDQGSNGNTPLAMAVRWGMAGIAKQLLGAGASIDYAGMDGLTPVWWAIKHSSVQMMELLMTPGAAVHLSSSNHETPLQGAVTVALRHGCFPEHLRVVSALLKAGADPNGYDQQGGTHSRPLHAAAAGGQVQLVELLVGAGAALDASSSRGTPLQLAVAAQAEQVVQALLAAGANPNACGSGGEEAASACHNASALELAMHKGPYAIVKALLAHGADPNAAHSSGQGTLLHAAVASSDRAAVEQLLAVGANPNAIRTTDGSTPLLLAVCQSDEAMVELLLAAGAQPNLVYSTHHITPLQHALLQRHQNLALKLLEAGADPNLGTGREVGMPLQLAIGQGPALVQVLLAAGAQPELADGYAVTALQLAVQQNLCQEVQLLLAKGADASVVDSISGDTLLHVAVRGDFSSMVELLVPTSADVNASNKRGYTPLMMALGDGHGLSSSRTWQLLLQHPRLDVNSGTPLHHAVRMGSTAAMHQLLQRGADPLAIDSKGYMPLHVAAAQGHLDIVQQLAAAGADVNAVAGRGQLGTPLQLAARGAYGEVVRWLLDHGAAASVSAATADGTTALHLACIRTGTEQMVTDLLGAGAEPGAANSSGNTPLHLAAAAGLQVTVGHLLAAGARAWVLNSNRELPLHLALAGGHSTLALQLIAAAKDADGVLNVISAAGMAPIHLAAVRQPSNILKELLCCKGLEVDVVDSAGQTALHKAAAGGHIDNLRQLVRHGASLDAADATGATPSHLAAAGVFGNCVRHLVTSGADKDAVDASGATPLHKAGAGVTPELVALLATPSNTSRVVDGTTLLHTAAAGDQEGLVSALLAAGAAAWQQDSRGESVLAMVARQGSTAMLRLLLRHLLWQHKVSGSADGALLPTEVLVALQQALAHDGEKSVWVFTTVMEVLGEGAASALWQELVQQHNPEQQQRWLGCIAVSALQEGLSAACVKLAGQQTSVTQPLEQALQGSIRQPGAATARPAAKQPLPQAAEALEGARGSAAAAAGVQRVFPTLATITAAAGLGQQQEVQGLLQQVPRAAQATALAEAAKAAGSGGHHQLCVQLVQRLAATHQGKALQVVQEVVAKLEGQPYQAVEVLGPSSLALCGALLGGWQAVRRQQQQEMVNGLVSAAVAWQQGQQLHKKRRQVT